MATARQTVDTVRSSTSSHGTGPSPSASDDAAAAARLPAGNLRTRKRTKTGCLTCRKRRIKCGEERPTCANCVKSKRGCEGYAPRLTFKDPLGAGHPGWAARGPPYPSLSAAAAGAAGQYARPGGAGAHGQLPPLAPRPVAPSPQPACYAAGGASVHWPGAVPYGGASRGDIPASATGPSEAPQAAYGASGTFVAPPPTAPAPYPVHRPPMSLEPFAAGRPAVRRSGTYGTYDPAAGQAHAISSQTWDPYGGGAPSFAAADASTHGPVPLPSRHFDDRPAFSDTVGSHVRPPVLAPPVSLEYLGPRPQGGYGASKYDRFEDDPEDPFDVDSDDEVPAQGNRPPHADLSLMQAMDAAKNDTVLRSHHLFLHRANVLATYQPKYTASPLMDATVARIFCHFIMVTAPGISSYERAPVNPSLLFQGVPVPRAQQSLWTYILPTMALSNRALLHAMLALASLQISKLQRTSPAAAMKHYHYAIRRIARVVALPTKRNHVATTAATLLLAHFELSTAEHGKWNSHLAGARQLLLEFDFEGIGDRVRRDSARARNPGGEHWSTVMRFWDRSYKAPAADVHPSSPDQALVSELMGIDVRHDDLDAFDQAERARAPLTEKDVDNYNMHSDLFWFFCKQDTMNSTVSGKHSLLPYHRWTRCPPRAPIARLDAIHGTSDHVLLVLGRVADFSSRDQARKRKAMEANGGAWRPRADTFPVAAAAIDDGIPGGRARAQAAPSMPTFSGMIPDVATPVMPAAFFDAPRDRIYTDPRPPSADPDPEAGFRNALAEWEAIRASMDTFERALGAPEWQPLPPSAVPAVHTAFGVAMQYGSYHIAAIWILFYTARIIHARTHPAMPPAAMVAAGIAAEQTAGWANCIGRIAFGFHTPAADKPLDPSLDGLFTEGMYSLFFAGVQFRDPAQRTATVQRLKYIATKVGQDTGWLVAAGLESCWTKSYQMGRGPYWQRTVGLKTQELESMEALPTGSTTIRTGDLIRLQHAGGVMGLEEDLDRMNILDG